MNWLLKAAAFKALSALPAGKNAYRLLREQVTDEATVGAHRAQDKFDLGVRYLQLARALSRGNRWRSMTQTPTSRDQELGRTAIHRSFGDVLVTELRADPLLWVARSSAPLSADELCGRCQ